MTGTIDTQARATAEQVIEVFVDDRLKALPLPAGFWDDAYVLGFLMCATIQMTQGRHGDALEPLAVVEATFEALGAMSGKGTEAVKTRVGECQDAADADYLRAMVSADKLVRHVTGASAMRDDPLIAAIREKTVQLIESGAFGDHEITEESAMRAVLVTTLFTEVVMERFGLAADEPRG